MKFGDQVVFTENSKEYSATVLSERILDSHAGSNSEPLLSIGYFAEVPGFAGTARQGELVQFRADVAHESVTAIDGVIYPGGRWREGLLVLPQAVGGAMELPEHVTAEARAIAEKDGKEVGNETAIQGASSEPPPTVQ